MPGPEVLSPEETVQQFLSGMFNPTIATLPNYDKAQGEAVTHAWSPRLGFVFMELQSVGLAESAARVLHGLDIGGKQLRVRTVTPAEAELPQI